MPHRLILFVRRYPYRLHAATHVVFRAWFHVDDGVFAACPDHRKLKIKLQLNETRKDHQRDLELVDHNQKKKWLLVCWKYVLIKFIISIEKWGCNQNSLCNKEQAIAGYSRFPSIFKTNVDIYLGNILRNSSNIWAHCDMMTIPIIQIILRNCHRDVLTIV